MVDMNKLDPDYVITIPLQWSFFEYKGHLLSREPLWQFYHIILTIAETV
jgi:hypothetical protein